MKYDLLIVGSGPAGLSAAVYGKRANLKLAVVEKEYEGSGQIAESGKVDNYLGLPGISGYDLGEKFREHAISLGTEFIEKEVNRLEVLYEEDGQKVKGYRLTFSDQASAESRAVIYAAGAYPRRAQIKGEELYSGKGVSYCAICDGAFCRGKTAAVLGGGDSALDDALYLSEIAEKVYLIHRRDSFRGAESSLELVKSRENIELILKESVEEFLGDKKLSAIRLGSGRILEVSGAFVAYGSLPQNEPVKGLVQLDSAGYILAPESGEAAKASSGEIFEGFYAAGDIRSKKLRQLVTAVSDGANAATAVADYINQKGSTKE